MNIFIDTEDMEERYGEELYKEYLEKENQQLKSTLEEIREKIENTCICDYDSAVCFIDEILQKIDKGVNNEYKNEV